MIMIKFRVKKKTALQDQPKNKDNKHKKFQFMVTEANSPTRNIQ